VVGFYVPLLPVTLDGFDSAEMMLDAVEYEITYLPEYYWWDGFTDTEVGCNLGGTLTLTATDSGDAYRFDECGFMDGLVLTGEGAYDYESDVFTLDVHNGPETCVYRYERSGVDQTVEDECPDDAFSE